MTSANKRKGDRAERAVLSFVQKSFPGSFKTRAGFNDDLGDVIVEHPAGRVVLQVKDVAKPNWLQWFSQLKNQVRACAISSAYEVLGGVIVHKHRGCSDPGAWRVVVPLRQFFGLLNAAYIAGGAVASGKRPPLTGLWNEESDMNVTVFTQPGCHPCKLTTRKMDQLGISYTLVDVSVDESAAQAVRTLGFTSTPVVQVTRGDEVVTAWQGMRPSHLMALASGGDLASLDMRGL